MRYLLMMALTVAALAAPVAAFNVHVDPYDVFAQLPGPHPVRLDTSLRMAKAWAIRSDRPDCLILGTSRAEIGYRPQALPADCERPYNAAVPAGRIYEARRHLQHALAFGTVKHVLLALDLEMFSATVTTGPGFSEARLAVNPDGRRSLYPAGELVGLALGRDATMRSWERWHERGGPPAVKASGERNDDLLEHDTFTHDLGVESKRQFLHLGGLMDGIGAKVAEAPLREYQRILDLCRDNHVSLRIVVNPIHVSVHDYMQVLGLQATYVEWKQRVATIAAGASKQQDLEFWDFGRLNAATTEDLDFTAMRMAGYWEPSHFRDVVGDQVLALVYAGRPAATPDFGARLTSGLSASDVAAYVQGVQAWSATHAAIGASLSEWAAEVRAHQVAER